MTRLQSTMERNMVFLDVAAVTLIEGVICCPIIFMFGGTFSPKGGLLLLAIPNRHIVCRTCLARAH